MDVKSLYDSFVESFNKGKYSEAIRTCTKILERETRPEKRVVHLLNRAVCYFNSDLHKKCVQDCDAAIAQDPNYIRAYVRKGQSLWKLGKQKEAGEVWTAATQIPGDIDYRMHAVWHLENGFDGDAASAVSQAQSKQLVSASQNPSSENGSPSVSNARPSASSQSPSSSSVSSPAAIPAPKRSSISDIISTGFSDSVEDIRIDGRALTPQEALTLASFQSGIKYGSGDPEYDKYLAMGYLCVNTHRLDVATRIFDVLIEEKPRVVASFIGRGTAYALRGEYLRALEDFTSALDIDRTVAEAWKRRGQVRGAMGLEKEALADMNEAVNVSGDSESYQQRGNVYHKQKNYRRALADFRKAYDFEPDNKIVIGFLALNEYSTGNVLVGIEYYKRLLEMEPNVRDPYISIGQAYKDYGDFENSKTYLEKGMEIDPNHAQMRHIYAMAFYGTGRYTEAIANFTKVLEIDPNYNESLHMRAVAHHGLGQHAFACQEYEKLVKGNPSHVAWYQRECAIYQHNRLDTDLRTFNMDMELHKHFKEGWCKKHAPESLPNYQKQIYNTSIPDVVFSATTDDPLISKYLHASKKFGMKMMLNTQGFLNNLRQQRSCGFAIIEMAQVAREIFRSKEVYMATGKTSSYDANPHPFTYRDFLDVGIKWRQYSEPNDSVWWIDMLSPEQFIEGFGSQTPMITGQVHVVRYYPYAGLSVEVMKKELIETCNPTPKIAALIKRAKYVGDLFELMGRDFWVITPCFSTKYPEKRMEGTRLTVQGLPPEGFDFSIRTPGTPPRWKDYDEELNHIWGIIIEEARKEDRDMDKLIDHVLILSFYWFNFMPLSRGTAALGYCSFHALFLALGFEIDAQVPKGVQFDWEAILRPTTADFLSRIRPWVTANFKPCNILDEFEKPAEEVFCTLRKVIEACNLDWP